MSDHYPSLPADFLVAELCEVLGNDLEALAQARKLAAACYHAVDSLIDDKLYDHECHSCTQLIVDCDLLELKVRNLKEQIK